MQKRAYLNRYNFRKKKEMKFPWSKPSAYEIMKTLLDEFTPEEIEILNGDDCAVPHMYSRLLKKSKNPKLSFSLELDAMKQAMDFFFYTKRDKIRDPEFQSGLYDFLTDLLSYR